ncbi:hypothetical protein ASZ90_016979 [hydrocarbon metagenome]|uniref:Uncharacterized protein n=1 Tax=hydrocarbon metagenome TaxID=938273 RepID=A0A0W8EAE0_9ZZZZ
MQAEGVGVVILEERTPLKKAVLLKAAIQDYEDQIAVIRKEIEREYEARTEGIREVLETTRAQYRRIITSCVDQGIFQEGRYSIEDKSRKVRTVNTERFRQAFPELFDQLAQVPVTKAEALVGKYQLVPLCDVSTSPPVWELVIRKGSV